MKKAAEAMARFYGFRPQERRERPFLRTGILTLDQLIGKDIRPGTVTEIFGATGAGRTSLLLAIGRYHKQLTGWDPLFLDCEHALDAGHVQRMELDPLTLGYARPGSTLDVRILLDSMKEAFRNGDLVMIDGLSSLKSPNETMDTNGKVIAALKADDMVWMGKLAAMCKIYILVANPIRQDIQAGKKVSTAGHAANVVGTRIALSPGGLIKRAHTIGFWSRAVMVSNPKRPEAEFEITWRNNG